MCRSAGDVDDAAFAALAHRRAELLAGEQHTAGEIHVEVRLPILKFDGFKRMICGDRHLGIIAAGGIDQNRGRAERGFKFLMRFAETAT